MKNWINKSLIIGCISAMSFLTLYNVTPIFPVNNIVLAEEEDNKYKVEDVNITTDKNGVIITSMPEQVITGEGVFTGYEKGRIKCKYKDPDSIGMDTNKNGSYTEDGEEPGFIIGALTDMVLGLVGGIANWLSGELCNPNETSGLGFLAQMYVFAKPVNLTTSPGLMSVTGIVQWMSLTMMIFGILYYGYRYMHPSAFKWVDPVQMVFKYFLAMILIYWAPFFLQDIININNIIVTSISEFSIPVGKAAASVQAVLPMAFVGFVESAIGDGGSWMGLIDAIVMLVVVVLCLVPMMGLVCWWYIRLIKLYIYTAISPIFFAQFVIDSRKTSQFIMNFTRDVFSQFFVVVGILVIGTFIGEIPTLVEESKIGVLGLGLALYAALSFIRELPGLANGLFEGQVDGPSAGEMAVGATRLGKRAAGGAVIAGVGAAALGGKAIGGIAKGGTAGLAAGARGVVNGGRAVMEKGVRGVAKDAWNSGSKKVTDNFTKAIDGGKSAIAQAKTAGMTVMADPKGAVGKAAYSATKHFAENGDQIKEKVNNAVNKTGDVAGKAAVAGATAAAGVYKVLGSSGVGKKTPESKNTDKILSAMKTKFGQEKKEEQKGNSTGSSGPERAYGKQQERESEQPQETSQENESVQNKVDDSPNSREQIQNSGNRGGGGNRDPKFSNPAGGQFVWTDSPSGGQYVWAGNPGGSQSRLSGNPAGGQFVWMDSPSGGQYVWVDNPEGDAKQTPSSEGDTKGSGRQTQNVNDAKESVRRTSENNRNSGQASESNKTGNGEEKPKSSNPGITRKNPGGPKK